MTKYNGCFKAPFTERTVRSGGKMSTIFRHDEYCLYKKSILLSEYDGCLIGVDEKRKNHPENAIFEKITTTVKTTELKFNIIDSYLELLKSLSPDSRIELISKLSSSLKGSGKSGGKSLRDLYGALRTRKSADQLIAELKMSRNFHRKSEQF